MKNPMAELALRPEIVKMNGVKGTTPPYLATTKELEHGDVVELEMMGGPFNTAVVRHVWQEDGYHYATFFRPYVHTGDVVYSKGLICYIGTEEFTVMSREDKVQYINTYSQQLYKVVNKATRLSKRGQETHDGSKL